MEPIFAVMMLRPVVHRMKMHPLIIREVRGDIVRKMCVAVVADAARIETLEAAMSWRVSVQVKGRSEA